MPAGARAAARGAVACGAALWLVACPPGGPAPAGAAGWTVGATGSGRASADTVPSAPTGAAANCGTIALSITVSWIATARATSYTVYRATSSSGPFSVVASGVTATTWDTPVLAIGTYWFQVGAVTGANWAGPVSATTQSRTITAVLCS